MNTLYVILLCLERLHRPLTPFDSMFFYVSLNLHVQLVSNLPGWCVEAHMTLDHFFTD